MGCRSFLTVEDSQRNADGSHKYYGRFNQGVVTINLVDVACSSEGDMDEFWKILDERLELCHRALRCRHERLLGTISDVAPILWQNGALARLKKGEKIDRLLFDGYSTISLGYAGLYEMCMRMLGVAPILWQNGALARLKKGEKIDRLLFDGYSTISLGYAGLYEMCMRMLGKSHTDPEARPFALKVMQRLNDKCKEWKEAEHISYSVYGTPMESTTYKFSKCLQKRFGIIPGVTDKNYIKCKEWKEAEHISYSVYGTPMESTTYKFSKCLQKRFGIIPGVTDKNYITNSYHVHVSEQIDAFSKLKFEAEFQKLSPGGAVSYVEVPNMQNNIPAVLSVMKFIYNNIMYPKYAEQHSGCFICDEVYL